MSCPRLGVTLSRAHHAFMGVLDAQLRACGLAPSVRPGMGHVLFELLEEDDLRLSELSDRARVAQSTVTEITAKMEAAGLLRRRPDSHDGRAFRVRLTRRGRALRPRLKELDRRLDQVYAAELSAREIAALMRLLERLRSALTAELAQRRRG
jgi:DNA-binding MarR family transcriptional regulator